MVSTDLPTAMCNAGATAVSKAAILLKKETTVDMVKADIRTGEEELLDAVLAEQQDEWQVSRRYLAAPVLDVGADDPMLLPSRAA